MASGDHLLIGLLGGAALTGIAWVISRKLAKIGLVIDQSFATFGDWPHLNEEAQFGDARMRAGSGNMDAADALGEIAPHETGSTS